jgi:hypothetical protein
MNRFAYRLKGALLALALVASLAGAAQATTVAVTVTPSAYVDLGAGPLDVVVNGAAGIELIVADTQPAASVVGDVLNQQSNGMTPKREFCSTTHVWAISQAAAGSNISVITPTTCPAAVNSSGAGIVYDTSYATKTPQYCQITVPPTAASLASLLSAAGCAAIPTWATLGVLTPETPTTFAIRWRADGTNPTASLGEPVFGDTKDPCLLGFNTISNTWLISATGGPVLVDVRIGG